MSCQLGIATASLNLSGSFDTDEELRSGFLLLSERLHTCGAFESIAASIRFRSQTQTSEKFLDLLLRGKPHFLSTRHRTIGSIAFSVQPKQACLPCLIVADWPLKVTFCSFPGTECPTRL